MNGGFAFRKMNLKRGNCGLTSKSRIGEFSGKLRVSPETQSRVTVPSSWVLRHSRFNFTSGIFRKKAANMVSRWQFDPNTGKELYGRSK